MDAATRQSYQEHTAHPNGVIWVTVFLNGEEVAQAGFRDLDAMLTWSDRFDDAHTAVYCPYVIDEPDFGNVKPN